MKNKITPLLFLTFILFSCKKEEDAFPDTIIKEYNFESGYEGWQVNYTDYPFNLSAKDSLELYEMIHNHSPLPVTIQPTQSGIKIRGHNRSDDLCMYVQKKITGLRPNTLYSLDFTIQIGSNAATKAIGVGGAPGESVYIKAGASNIEPKKIIGTEGNYNLNIDKGQQSQDGNDMIVIGHIGVTDTTTQYSLIERKNSNPFLKQSNDKGELWLIVGTDSGYEGLTEIYYASITVELQKK
ncbi:MAG: hypothetical protein KA143_04065 [Saprospiraceae bacterium]|nr:hypothetical protein [Saprospiraceae bacterium]